MNRRKTRETALKLTYETIIHKNDYEGVLEVFTENFINEKPEDYKDIDMVYVERIVKGVTLTSDVLEEKIKDALVNWNMGRISKINMAIMKISTYEMLNEKEIPINVSINEAIELAKKYSDDGSVSFINGVLDKVSKSI